jgi:hypothetical protein
MRAVSECVPATGGVLIQFPFYAVIFGMIVGTGITDVLAKLFAAVSTHNTYPLVVAIYSAVLGVFIPSGGSKWVIEAPYILQAGESILDAAAARDHQIESARHCGLRSAATDRPPSGGFLFVLALRTIYSVFTAGAVANKSPPSGKTGEKWPPFPAYWLTSRVNGDT